MTVDDENSVYVGGLPYDATEDSVRRVFNIYGAIVAVKIINDQKTRGKCYGFVTFTNPRSAIDAINDMDGKTIDGRVVRVNEVTTRSQRSNFSRDHVRRNADRGTNWGRARNQERDHDRDEDRHRDPYNDRSRERGHSWNRNEDRERGYDPAYDHDQSRDHFLDTDQDLEDNERDHSDNYEQERERDRDLDWDQGVDVDVSNGHLKTAIINKDQHFRKHNGSPVIDRRSRELSSDSSGRKYKRQCVQVEEQIEKLSQRREDLKTEVSLMEEQIGEKHQLILDLQKKSKKLEDALISAKKLSSQRQSQLSKLHKGFLKVRDYTEKLKNCEEELKYLVDSSMTGNEMGDNAGSRDGVLANGNA
ncbi:zinc finger CCCH domain-containing protein 25 isoform X1 [Tripterygium wilfordii]|uniref:zinc finger CCCH domain-containing protein 25 isoform X1 n=1 Tax=Tripterygium wilfordii TaxID=458696 RepID=UPI0018F7FFBD|nr:zinc finger CCCH domain-containing protein 25 isoform X1 [Tripterygium wilfordii]